MKLISALRLAVSLGRTVGTRRSQLVPAYAPPPSPRYYGDYGPPPRYVRALGGRDPYRYTRAQRAWSRPDHGDDDE